MSPTSVPSSFLLVTCGFHINKPVYCCNSSTSLTSPPEFPFPFFLQSPKVIFTKSYFCSIFSLSNSLSVQFSSGAESCPTPCDPMNCSTPGLPVHHQLPESTQTHVHQVGDAIQPSHPLSSPSPAALNLSQHQGLFKRVSFSHQVAKVLEFQLHHQSFQ